MSGFNSNLGLEEKLVNLNIGAGSSAPSTPQYRPEKCMFPMSPFSIDSDSNGIGSTHTTPNKDEQEVSADASKVELVHTSSKPIAIQSSKPLVLKKKTTIGRISSQPTVMFDDKPKRTLNPTCMRDLFSVSKHAKTAAAPAGESFDFNLITFGSYAASSESSPAKQFNSVQTEHGNFRFSNAAIEKQKSEEERVATNGIPINRKKLPQ